MGGLEERVKRYAKALGFDLVGITSAEPFLRDENAAVDRIRQGLMDGLPWYTEERVHRATHPELLLAEARSVISLAMSYYTGEAVGSSDGPMGRVGRYAWGDDYHEVIKARLSEFVQGLGEWLGREVRSRVFVDDGPMNDRAAAERAGIGWFGKNTNILTTSHGSWVFLAQVITDLDLEADRPLLKNCGECVLCIEACPTGAIVTPYVLDNTRCISYLTIENRGSISKELRPQVGDWVFGCDVCQDVCPVNRAVPLSGEPAFSQRHGFAAPELVSLLDMDDEAFRERFRKSPIKRAKRSGLQRNVCVALGNVGGESDVPALADALRSRDSMVRAHAAWALGRLGGRTAGEALEATLAHEDQPDVVDEIEAALVELNDSADSR